MVALTVGGIALGAIYSVGAASTAHFREQQRVANTQTSLRMAMAQLKKDFQRAGFLASASAGQPGEVCAAPPNALHNPGVSNTGGIAAISWFNSPVGAPSNLNPAGAQNPDVVVSEVVLMGNYSTSGEYGGLQVVNNTSVSISRTGTASSATSPTGTAPTATSTTTRSSKTYSPSDAWFVSTPWASDIGSRRSLASPRRRQRARL